MHQFYAEVSRRSPSSINPPTTESRIRFVLTSVHKEAEPFLFAFAYFIRCFFARFWMRKEVVYVWKKMLDSESALEKFTRA